MTTKPEPTKTVAEHFETIDGCTVASVSEGRVELTLTAMSNCPNGLPGGRESADVLVDAWGYGYTLEFPDEDTCVVLDGGGE